MFPWAVWTVLVAAINLTLFVAIRGRWSGQLLILVVASLLGTAAGNFAAELLGFDLLVLGEFHLVGAVIGAQLALITTAAVATLVSSSRGPDRRRDGSGPAR
jgi:hypothetical protein